MKRALLVRRFPPPATEHRRYLPAANLARSARALRVDSVGAQARKSHQPSVEWRQAPLTLMRRERLKNSAEDDRTLAPAAEKRQRSMSVRHCRPAPGFDAPLR